MTDVFPVRYARYGEAMARWTETWLSGARPVEEESSAARVLPVSGSGSRAPLGRRAGALVVDWLLSLLIAGALTGHNPFAPGHNSFVTLAVFGAEYLILVSLLGFTVGMRLFGIRIMAMNGGRLAPVWVLVRTALLLLVVPAVIYDRDYRGLHDRAADSVVVRL